MTVTHTNAPAEGPAAKKPAKPKKAKNPAPTAKAETTPEQPASDEQPTAEQGERPAPEKPAKRGKSKRPVPLITMKVLGERYVQHLADSGKSQGTALSYLIEITTATKFLGEDTPIASLTPNDVRRFNDSKQVMLLKSGKPKAQPSYLKTQRVLRLALVWAAEQGWIEKAPLPEAESK